MKASPNLARGVLLISIGIGANFLAYEVNSLQDTPRSLDWSLLDVAPVSPHDPVNVRRFLGLDKDGAKKSEPHLVQEEEENEFQGRSFMVDGIEYRLSGLVLDGEDATVTFVQASGVSRSLKQGEIMPVGREILSISINQIVTQNNEGRIESIPIYPTTSERK